MKLPELPSLENEHNHNRESTRDGGSLSKPEENSLKLPDLNGVTATPLSSNKEFDEGVNVKSLENNKVNNKAKRLNNPFEDIEVDLTLNHTKDELEFKDIPINNLSFLKADIEKITEPLDDNEPYFDDIPLNKDSKFKTYFEDIPISTNEDFEVNRKNTENMKTQDSKLTESIDNENTNSIEPKNIENEESKNNNKKPMSRMPGKHIRSKAVINRNLKEKDVVNNDDDDKEVDDNRNNITLNNVESETTHQSDRKSEINSEVLNTNINDDIKLLKEKDNKEDNIEQIHQDISEEKDTMKEVHQDIFSLLQEDDDFEEEDFEDFEKENIMNQDNNENESYSKSNNFKELNEEILIKFLNDLKNKFMSLINKKQNKKANKIKSFNVKSMLDKFKKLKKPKKSKQNTINKKSNTKGKLMSYLLVGLTTASIVGGSAFMIMKNKNTYKSLSQTEFHINENDVNLKLYDFNYKDSKFVEFKITNNGDISSNSSVDITFESKKTKTSAKKTFYCESDIIALEPGETLNERLNCNEFVDKYVYKTYYKFNEY